MMSLYSGGERPVNETDVPPAWQRAEEAIREEFDLVEEHGPHHDAREADGTRVEIKSCIVEYADGRVGRFEIWESQLHALWSDGKVALLVYSRSSRREIVATRMLRASALLHAGTRTTSHHPTMGCTARHRIPWPEVIPLTSVWFFQRRNVLEHYDDDEVAETVLPAPRGDEPDDLGAITEEDLRDGPESAPDE